MSPNSHQRVPTVTRYLGTKSGTKSRAWQSVVENIQSTALRDDVTALEGRTQWTRSRGAFEQ